MGIRALPTPPHPTPLHPLIECAPLVGSGRRAPASRAHSMGCSGSGATVVVDYDDNWGPVREHHIVMQDPEGNEFWVQ